MLCARANSERASAKCPARCSRTASSTSSRYPGGSAGAGVGTGPCAAALAAAATAQKRNTSQVAERILVSDRGRGACRPMRAALSSLMQTAPGANRKQHQARRRRVRMNSSMTPLDFHLAAGPFTAPGHHVRTLADLPRELPALRATISGLLIHEHLAARYGVELTPERKRESQLRPVEAMLDALLALDPRPLSAAREPRRRLCGVCRHFTVLL